MKTHSCLALVLLSFGIAICSSQTLHAQNPAEAVPSGPAPGGVLVREDGVFWVSEGKAGKLNAATLPPGQFLHSNGRLQPLPPGVTGLPSAAGASPEAGSAAETSGITLVNDDIFLVVRGHATRVDPASIPKDHMINWDGKIAAAPFGLTFVGSITPGVVPQGGGAAGAADPAK